MRIPWLSRRSPSLVSGTVVGAIGPLTGGVLGLERLVAESAFFRGRDGIDAGADLDLAKQHIFLFDFFKEDPDEIQRARPFAALWPADLLNLQEISPGAKYFLEPGGELVMVLTDRDRYPGLTNRRQSGLDFCTWVDQVLLDIAAAAGTDDVAGTEAQRLNIREIRLLQGVAHSHPKDAPSAGEFWHCAFLICWR